ncbi:hypothetical protein Tco_1539277 [Tanacetum coccineum]
MGAFLDFWNRIDLVTNELFLSGKAEVEWSMTKSRCSSVLLSLKDTPRSVLGFDWRISNMVTIICEWFYANRDFRRLTKSFEALFSREFQGETFKPLGGYVIKTPVESDTYKLDILLSTPLHID